MTLLEVVNHKVTWLLGGALVSLVGAFFAFSRDIVAQLHFIRGQNHSILEHFKALDRIKEKVTGLDKDVGILKRDINHAWDAIRTLKGGANGSHHASAE